MKIKVGQIGTGHAHAAGKMAAYRASDAYEVVGVVEEDPALRRVAEQAAEYRDLPWMSVEQLLNVPGLQAVAVETRVRDSLDAAEKCIAAGKHIHLDKPAGTSLRRFEALLNAAAAKHVTVQMGYMYRYNPGILLLRDFLKKGWLGEPFELHAVMSKVVPADGRRDLAEYPGGIMFELGCHILDLAVGLLGAPQQVHSFRQHVSPLADGLVDNMLAVLTYPKAIASLKTSAQEVEGGARRHLALCGTEGTFHLEPLDQPRARVAFSMQRGPYRAAYQEIRFPEYKRYNDDAADLARIVRHEKEAEFAYAHDLHVQRALFEACGLDASA